MVDLGYEAWMCAFSALALNFALKQQPEVDKFWSNVLVEGVLIHARCITEFLFKKESDMREMDMKRSEFDSDPSNWEPPPGVRERLFQDNYQLIHRHVAHPTWHRVDDRKSAAGESPSWLYLQVAVDAVGALESWSEHVRLRAPELITGSFTRQMDEAMEALAPVR